MNKPLNIFALLFLFSGLDFATRNPFPTKIIYSLEIDLGLDQGISRNDPSDVIHVGSRYYVWYTRIAAWECDYPAGYAGTIWYASSPDGLHWTEQGEAIGKRSVGAWDAHGVFTPNILASGKHYYVFYSGVSEPFSNEFKDATPTGIGVALAESPDGPRVKFPANPVLKPGKRGDWDDFRVNDSCLILRKSRYWLYYKGVDHAKKWRGLPSMGLAVASSPTGPYRRYKGESSHFARP